MELFAQHCPAETYFRGSDAGVEVTILKFSLGDSGV